MQDIETLTTEDILDAFDTAEGILLRDAIRQAAERWGEVGPVLLAVIENAAATPAADVSRRTHRILLFATYLMAQMRETRAFPLLCRLGRQENTLDAAIVDGITEDFAAILARVFDGDAAPLHALIEDASADQFARDAAFETLAWLAATGATDLVETSDYLRGLFDSLQPRDESYVWVGWQQAVSALGLRELAPLVEQVFERGWIDEMVTDVSRFREDLQLALRPDPPLREIFGDEFTEIDRYDDVAGMLATWRSFKPEALRPKALDYGTTRFATEPVRNPLRNVGRNDPCPCGSGKKFKKCCLGKAA